MPDEVPTEASTPEPAPEVVPEAIPEPIQPEVVAPVLPEPPTAQIPANEPIAPTPEPLPEPVLQPAPQAPVPVQAFAPITNFARDLAVKARAVIQGRKRKKLDKILEFVTTKGSITNDRVEKLLHVSDATATRYLTQLEKEGKLKQEGKTGKSVKYLKL